MKQSPNNSIRIRMLASGSGGNAILISSKNTNLLIDAGLSCKELMRRVACAGYAPTDISAVVITHEHQDHIRGIGVMSRRHGMPVFINPDTLAGATPHVGEVPSAHIFSTGDKLAVGDLTIQTYPVLHDAADPVGLSVYNGSKRIGIALDMGRPTTLVKQRLQGSDGLILEFNHDIEMLRQCSRPWDVKQRIMSAKGHMSNEDALDFLSELVHEQLTAIILAHISREANSSDHVLSLVSKRLKKIGRSDIGVFPASQDEVGGAIEV